MEKEKVAEVAKFLLAVLLIGLSLLVAVAVDLPVEMLIRVDLLLNPSPWVGMLAVSFLAPLGTYVLTSVRDRRLFFLGWTVLLLSSLILLKVNQLDDLTVVSFVLASVVAHGKEVRKLSHVWEKIRSKRGLASLVFLVVVSALIVPNAQYFNELFLEEALRWANSASPSGGSIGELVDVLIPSGVTPEEVKILEEQLASSLPEWNLLSPQEKNVILSQAVQQLVAFKEALKESIKKTVSSDRPLLTKETLLAFIERNEALSIIVNNLYIFLIFIALAVFSITTEIGSVIVFVLLLPFEWWRTRKLPKEEGC